VAVDLAVFGIVEAIKVDCDLVNTICNAQE
jgi:hypothetical protein